MMLYTTNSATHNPNHMTTSDIKRLKSIVKEFNQAASRPILDNASMDAEQKINALVEIIDLADIMATIVEETIFDEITTDDDLSEDKIP